MNKIIKYIIFEWIIPLLILLIYTILMSKINSIDSFSYIVGAFTIMIMRFYDDLINLRKKK
jgi:positive regulator of sigma E activity